MNQPYCARSDLLPNKEQQPDLLKRALRERYGFYRPVSPESAAQLIETLAIAKSHLDTYVDAVRGPEAPMFGIKNEFGVTFVKQQRMGRHSLKAFIAGFRMSDAIQRLESHNIGRGPNLEVPLNLRRLEWSDDKDRQKVVVKLAASVAFHELIAESRVVDQELSNLGLEDVVENPNHLTLMGYSMPKGARPLRGDEKEVVLQIVEAVLVQSKMGMVALQPLNVGTNYSQPCELWKNRREAIAQPELIR